MTKSVSFKLCQCHIALRLSLLSILTACAQMGQQPLLEVPKDGTELQLNAGQTVVVHANWWQQLQQPTLNQLITWGLDNAPDLRIAATRLQQAQAQARMVKGSAGAQVEMRASGISGYLDPKPDTSSLTQKHSNHVFSIESANLAFDYNLDFWGRQRNLIKAALGQQLAAQYQQQQAQLILIQTIVTQYTQWQLLVEEAALLTKRIELNQRIQVLLAQRIHAGLQPVSDAYGQNQTLLSLQSAYHQTLAEIDTARNSLAVLTGQSPLALAKLQPQSLDTVPLLAINQLRADILARRPDIAVQKALLQSKYYNIRAAKAEFYPNIQIEALAGLSHLNIFDLLHSTSRTVQFLPAISLPIFTSGRLQANLSGKHAEYNEQVAEYDKTVLTALQQAADAITDYQQSQSRLNLQKQVWAVAQRDAQANLRRQRAGLENALTSLRNTDSALSVQIDYLKVAAWHQQSWNNVQVALGGDIQLK